MLLKIKDLSICLSSVDDRRTIYRHLNVVHEMQKLSGSRDSRGRTCRITRPRHPRRVFYRPALISRHSKTTAVESTLLLTFIHLAGFRLVESSSGIERGEEGRKGYREEGREKERERLIANRIAKQCANSCACCRSFPSSSFCKYKKGGGGNCRG